MINIKYAMLCCSAMLTSKTKFYLKTFDFNSIADHHVVWITLIAVINDSAVSNDAYKSLIIPEIKNKKPWYYESAPKWWLLRLGKQYHHVSGSETFAWEGECCSGNSSVFVVRQTGFKCWLCHLTTLSLYVRYSLSESQFFHMFIETKNAHLLCSVWGLNKMCDVMYI